MLARLVANPGRKLLRSAANGLVELARSLVSRLADVAATSEASVELARSPA
jgi:hypothetical protein